MAIEGVAVRFQHEGAEIEVRLAQPNRHCDCFRYAADVLKLPSGSHSRADNQGFYDDKGNYLNRKQAMKHVVGEGRKLIPMSCGNVNVSPILFSEDLW